jgi:hypothetical protein
MPDMSPRGATADRPLSALPSVRARVLAFLAILVAGAAGALIGYSFVDIQCHGACATPRGIGGLVGGAFGAGGVAVVAVLTLRAMGEWRTIKANREAEAAAAAAALAAGFPDDQPSNNLRNPSA